MNYSIKSYLYDKYLLLKIDGEWSSENYERILDDIIYLFNSHNKLPLLINLLDVTSKDSVVGDYYEAAKFAEKGFFRLEKIAVLDIPNRKKANDFFETTAANRGLTFKFFYNDEQEAINWLLD